MKRRKLTLIFLVSLLCVWAGVQTSMAHTMFIQPTQFHLRQGKSSPFLFCYGHNIPFADGIRGKKLKAVSVISPAGDALAVSIRNETSLHSYMVDYNTPGTWILTAETTPGFYTVYVDKKGKEHHVIKPLSAVRDQAEKVVMSLFVKQYSKSYVACNSPSKGEFPVAGLGLELVPKNDLFALKQGQTLELEILKDGKPFTGQGVWDATYNGFSTQAEDMFFPKTKVKGSRFSMVIEHPGRWFLRYTTSEDAPEAERENYHKLKLSTSMVFQVDNERRR